MLLADYHTHTVFSPDAEDTMRDMALAALDRGMAEIVFTDHAENCADMSAVTDAFPPYEVWEEAHREVLSLRAELEGRITPLLGLELGSPHHDPEKAARIYHDPRLDFVIGSIHSLRGTDDFYFLEYRDPAVTRALFLRYLEESFEVVRGGAYDVLGHFGYFQRYIAARGGAPLDLTPWYGEIRDLFRLIVGAGKGIELNVSDLDGPLRSPLPMRPVLDLYREAGGEIITVGSDAHRKSRAGLHIREGCELLREAGFRYTVTYRAHKPVFHTI